mgnify:CR=1 FL=1
MSVDSCSRSARRRCSRDPTRSLPACSVVDWTSSLRKTARTSSTGPLDHLVSLCALMCASIAHSSGLDRDPIVFGHLLNFLRGQPPRLSLLPPGHLEILYEEAKVLSNRLVGLALGLEGTDSLGRSSSSSFRISRRGSMLNSHRRCLQLPSGHLSKVGFPTSRSSCCIEQPSMDSVPITSTSDATTGEPL